MNGQSGKAGEDHVAQWLEERGYKIVARNFHSRFGEIDIIAQREPYIAFVEVKTRSQGSLVSPFEAITPAKQRKLVTTAKLFLQRHPTDLRLFTFKRGGLWEKSTLKTSFVELTGRGEGFKCVILTCIAIP